MQKVIKELDRIRRQSRITDKGAKRLILKNRKDLNEKEKAKLDSYLQQSQRLRQAYELKEELLNIFERVGICEYFANRSRQRRLGAVTSWIMKGINNRIKRIKRQGYGFTNIANLILRLAYANRARLLAAFWP
ncbi:MAG: transposase [Synechococcaceae cyanobacterium SM2_3_1]|nr:transposase [Synechococcaceae cyanobacterium SM2_3_1]